MHHGTVKKDYKLTKETIMLDTRGAEIKIGSTVVHGWKSGRSAVSVAVFEVEGFTPKMVKFVGGSKAMPHMMIVVDGVPLSSSYEDVESD